MSPEAIGKILTDNEHLRESNGVLKSENEDLKEQLAEMRRMIFGQKRERFVPDENQTALDLGLEENETSIETEDISYNRRKNKKQTPHGREEIPAHFPRHDIHVEPDFDPAGMQKLPDRITEQLEYKAPEFHVTRYIRPVYVEVSDGTRIFHCPPLPPLCIDKGKAGPSMVARIMVAKGEDHAPIYRQQKQIKRDCGMDIPLTSLESWYAKGCHWVDRITKRLDQLLLKCSYLQMDESPFKVMIKPTHGKSSRGYMWSRYGPEVRIAIFHYDKRWSAAVAEELIGQEYQGILQTDGLKAYDSLGNRKTITHAGCHGHARRGFEKSLGSDRKRAKHGLKIYRKLFAIEEEALKLNMSPAKRLELRQRKSAPIMEEYKKWLDTEILNPKVLPKDKIGIAILYVLNRWNEMTRFLEDGRIELSTNWIENLFRLFALGRRNYLFAGSENGARRLANLYTILLTCKLNNVNSFKYLSHVLKELPAREEGADIDDLLPMNWKDPESSPSGSKSE